MHGMPSTRAHTATNFARVGGRICVIRGQSNRAYYMLYPDAAPFCFRVGTSNACNWQIYAEGVAARHFDLLWDGFALWAEPLHGSTPIRLNGATHRHRVRIAGDTRLSVGDAFIDILVGTEPAQPDRAEPKPERTAQPPRPRDSQFHIARPPQPVDGDRVHLRTAVGVPVDAARMAQNELDAIRRAALALAHTGHLESGRARRSHTQPIFAISPSEPERPLSEPPRSLFPVGALDSEQPIPAVAEHCAFPGEDVPYARSEPPRASGIAPRVFSDAPPANAAPYAHAGPREPVTWQRSALECTLRGAPANQQGPASAPDDARARRASRGRSSAPD